MLTRCLHLFEGEGACDGTTAFLHLCEWRISYCCHLIKNICIWVEHLGKYAALVKGMIPDAHEGLRSWFESGLIYSEGVLGASLMARVA